MARFGDDNGDEDAEEDEEEFDAGDLFDNADWESYREERMSEMISEGLLKGDDREQYLPEYLSLYWGDDEVYGEWSIEDWLSYLEQ